MTKSANAVVIILGAIFLLSLPAMGQSVPPLINYQGRLSDGAGMPVNGTRAMRFSFLDGDTSGAAVLWGETQAAVQVTQGIYNVLLGSVNPIPASAFSAPSVFLEVRVGGERLLPRRRMTSAAYAFRAESAGMCLLADTLDGLDSTDFADALHGHDFTDITGLISAGQVGVDAITTLEIVDGSIAGVDLVLDSLGADQIEDVYLFNSGDTVTGDFQCSADVYVAGKLGVHTTNPVGVFQVDVISNWLEPDAQNQMSDGFLVGPYWQSFKPQIRGDLTQLDLYVSLPGGYPDLNIIIRAGEGTSGPVIWTGTFVQNFFIGWAPFTINPPLPVEAGQSYTIEFICEPCLWRVGYGDPYPNGLSCYGSEYDLAFKTYLTNYPHTALQVNEDAKVDINHTLSVTQENRVGINTDAPTTALDVQGEVKSTVSGQEFYMVPKGGIIMWSGAIAAIPAGWRLCDGTNGTPDLRDRFIVGTASAVGETGGSDSKTLSVDNLPPHSHNIWDNYASNINADFWIGGLSVNSLTYSQSDAYYHHSTENAGSGTSFDVRPAYYKLAFIMRQ